MFHDSPSFFQFYRNVVDAPVLKYRRKKWSEYILFPAPSALDYYLRNLTAGDCYARSHQRPINLWGRGCSPAVYVEDPHMKCNWPNSRMNVEHVVNVTTAERRHDRPYRRSLVTSSLRASCHFHASKRSHKRIRAFSQWHFMHRGDRKIEHIITRDHSLNGIQLLNNSHDKKHGKILLKPFLSRNIHFILANRISARASSIKYDRTCRNFYRERIGLSSFYVHQKSVYNTPGA